MQHPYHHQPPAIAAIDLDPEAVVSRQEAMIQAGTHAMIAEKLALDAVRQSLRLQPQSGYNQRLLKLIKSRLPLA